MTDSEDLFHPPVELPEPVRAARYARLVGLDDVKARLRTEAQLLANPRALETWSQAQYGTVLPALELFADRPPLILFSGDVGTGKSALAESFGCDLSDQLDVPVFLYRLKLTTRGSGLVGEMTTLISSAFEHLRSLSAKALQSKGPTKAYIFVIDEADALMQSRAMTAMHHEDRAGVDAVLEGVDSLAGQRLPLLVVLCTNRGASLDPAVLRRVAVKFDFGRPNPEQRRVVLANALRGMGISDGCLDKLADLSGSTTPGPSFTYSDLTQRFIPALVLRAFPSAPVTDELAFEVIGQIKATPEFGADQ